MRGVPSDTVTRRLAAGTDPVSRLLRRTDTGAAAGLAGATLVSNVVQLGFTVAVTRLLGADDYGALAAIVGLFLILLVAGQAVQAAAARETALGALGGPQRARRTVRTWTLQILGATAVLVVVGVLLREPLAALAGTQEHPWAAAAVPATGGLWMLVSLQRGVLQGIHSYVAVGTSLVLEALARLVLGVGLVVAGAGVTGAFVATPLTMGVTAVVLGVVIVRRLREPAGASVVAVARISTLRELVAGGWVPIIGLLLLALLQNVDVVIARHVLDDDRAGAYAIAAVAAKSVVWVAIGVGLQLLPEATRRAATGLDPRPVLARALGVLVAVATPALVVFAVVPGLVLRIGFGPDGEDGAAALPLLGVAMTLLAISYLTVQYMLALHLVRFLGVLAAVAGAEIALLLGLDVGLESFAAVVLAAQVVATGTVLALGWRAARPGRPAPPPPVTAPA